MKTTFFLFILIALLKVVPVVAQDNTSLKGKLINPNSDKCYLYAFKEDKKNHSRTKTVLDSSVVSSDGSFAMAFNIKEQTNTIFFDGTEQTTVLFDVGDDLTLSLNTNMFDATIMFSGKGAEKNNAIKNCFIITQGINEKIFAFGSDVDTSVIFSYMNNAYKDYLKIVADYKKEIPSLANFATEEEMNAESIKEEIRDNAIFNSKMQLLKGTNALDFTGVDLKGNKLSSSSFKGKITIIDFWATWCGPCKAEMPSLKELEEKYGEQINFVSVALYCKKDDWLKMATKLGFKNNIYLSKEDEKQIEGYSVGFIPRYLVIDENLKVIDAHAPRPSSGDLQKYFKLK
ncbi:MAG: TlpA family protein disulfide reductase [Bacteroidetes bacterium]|nr:TlpA family protein disulfide reductase [Bacteroidota bacterium]